jgi:hypothetical protein
MADEPRAMREIHEIREQLAKETAHMTSEEHVAHVNNIAEELARKYGFKLVRSPNPLQPA